MQASNGKKSSMESLLSIGLSNSISRLRINDQLKGAVLGATSTKKSFIRFDLIDGSQSEFVERDTGVLTRA